MSLNRYLIVRMIALGLLCWLALSAYVVYRTSNEVRKLLDSDSVRLTQMVEYALYKRQSSPEQEGSPALIGSQYGLYFQPYCIEYSGWNGFSRKENCDQVVNHPFSRQVLQWVGIQTRLPARKVGLWGQPFGELTIEADSRRVLVRFWNTLLDLLVVTTLMLVALTSLTAVVITRALKHTGLLVRQLDSIASQADREGKTQRLPVLKPREFDLIAKGINRMDDRLHQLTETQRKLMARLLGVQEAERRELAHWLHADLGQSLSLMSVHCSRVRHALRAGNPDETALEVLDELEEAIENAFEQMRRMLVNKCPPVVTGNHLGVAFTDLCTRWEMEVGPSISVSVNLNSEALARLDRDQALCMYRTLEEGLANARRHAGSGGLVQIHLDCEQDLVVLLVRNALPDRASGGPVRSGGLGLALLSERMRIHGGQLQASIQDSTFQLRAELVAPASGETT